jgi:hypothetical protein
MAVGPPPGLDDCGADIGQRPPDTVRRRAVESWLRRRGLPMAVRHDRSVLQRSVPALVCLLLFDVAVYADNLVFGESEGGAIIAAAFVPNLVLAWLAARLIRRAAQQTQRVLTWSVFALVVVVEPAVSLLSGSSWWDPVLWPWLPVLTVVGIVYFGVVSILGWALRIAVRRFAGFGGLTSRALPLLMLFTLFGFFTAEIWQAIDALAPRETGRDRLWLVIALFVVLTSLFLISVLRDEALAMVDRLRALDLSEYAPQLRKTPLEGLLCTATARRPLSMRERLNLGLVLYLGHALQAFAFSAVVFVFFVSFGSIAIDPSVVEAWVEHPPTTGSLFALPLPPWLPVPDELIKVSLFLAAFSGMYFAAHMARDETYRSCFFEPFVTEVAISLAARDLYLAVWHDEPSAEEPEPGEVRRPPDNRPPAGADALAGPPPRI